VPHFIIEQGRVLNSQADIDTALQIVADCGASDPTINPRDVKVRIIAVDHFLALDGRESSLHVTVKLLAGRTPEQKTDLSARLRDVLQTYFDHADSISVDIRNMDPVCYKKHLRAPDPNTECKATQVLGALI
jgi:5-carboxymethyl-2-hydroxymuconate isomerase